MQNIKIVIVECLLYKFAPNNDQEGWNNFLNKLVFILIFKLYSVAQKSECAKCECANSECAKSFILVKYLEGPDFNGTEFDGTILTGHPDTLHEYR